jgi:hypothetical protein
VLLRPVIGGWEVPRIERIRASEARRLAVLPVPGLAGDLQQDLGRGALVVEIAGSLSGDDARDAFLAEVRERFLAGSPVDFVADITKESELERVLIERLDLEERAGDPDGFRYRVVLREYTEPPEPPGLGEGFGLDVDAGLDLDVDLGLDLLDIPGLVADLPEIGDLLSPVKTAAEELKSTLSRTGRLLGPLEALLDGGDDA